MTRQTVLRGKRSAVRVVVCDVGLGNIRSVERALREASRGRRVQVDVTQDPAHVRTADKLVMPGQSAFGDYARALSGTLGDAVREHIRGGRPYLGICMGLQALFGESEEAPGCAGMGILEGAVVKLRGGIDATTQAPLKVPHVGWNEAEPTVNRGLFAAQEPMHFYFVHSFVVVPRDARMVAATTEYGTPFVSAIAFENVFACQFHPEKSQRAGLAMLERFVAS
jgi:glutamine amidotransferase